MKKNVKLLVDRFEENLEKLELADSNKSFGFYLGTCLAYADAVNVISGDGMLCAIMIQKVDKVRLNKEAML